MMKMRDPIFAVFCLTAACLPATQLLAQANMAETCIGDWARASLIVEQRKIMDVAGLSKWVEEKYASKLMSTRLCHAGNDFFYRLVMRDVDGRLQRLKVDGAGVADEGRRRVD